MPPPKRFRPPTPEEALRLQEKRRRENYEWDKRRQPAKSPAGAMLNAALYFLGFIGFAALGILVLTHIHR